MQDRQIFLSIGSWYRFIFVFVIMTVHCAWPMNVDQLRCEYRNNPLGIDNAQPRLSWILSSEERGDIQTAYQILVASNDNLLTEDRADLWNSGKVLSNNSVHVVYQGKILQSKQRYFWKMRV